MSTDSPNDDCRTAWQTITEKAFQRWEGLPESCTYSDFDDAFERQRESHARGTLGRAKIRTNFRRHVADGYSEPLKVWFRDDDVVAIEVSYPDLPYPDEELLNLLGEPATRFDYHLDVLPISGGSWVYPDRGLALFLDAANEKVMRLSLFTRCSLEEYVEEIKPDAAPEEFPLE